jgi:hypothetical protein
MLFVSPEIYSRKSNNWLQHIATLTAALINCNGRLISCP